MTKIAFMFPGQGSLEAGMGKDVAAAVPEAMAVYDAGSAASGIDLKELCFERPVEDLVDTEVQQPALVATCLALRRSPALARHPPRRRRRPLRRRVLGARRRPSRCRCATRSRSCASAALAMAAAAKAHPGSMAAILGLADEAVESALPQDHECLAGELQLPRPARHLRRDAVGRRGLRRGDA